MLTNSPELPGNRAVPYKNRMWLPSSAEILTTEGWEKLQNITKYLVPVMAADLESKKVVQTCLKGTLTLPPRRRVLSTVNSETQYIEFWKAMPLEKTDLFPAVPKTGLYGYRFEQVVREEMLIAIEITDPSLAVFVRHPFTKGQRRIHADPNILDEPAQDWEGEHLSGQQEPLEERTALPAGAEAWYDIEAGRPALSKKQSRKKLRKNKNHRGYSPISPPDYWIGLTEW
jgi:hypothetical protein